MAECASFIAFFRKIVDAGDVDRLAEDILEHADGAERRDKRIERQRGATGVDDTGFVQFPDLVHKALCGPFRRAGTAHKAADRVCGQIKHAFRGFLAGVGV